MDVWTTKLREEIEGFQVDIIMSGKGCILNDKVRKEIAKALKREGNQDRWVCFRQIETSIFFLIGKYLLKRWK